MALKPTYPKPFLSTDQQLDLVESRGIRVSDRRAAVLTLQTIGYYRLSGYWYPFRERNAEHREGLDVPAEKMKAPVDFEDIVALAEFDRRLRNIILAATEPFETAIRVSVARTVGANDPFAYLNQAYWGKAAHITAPGLGGQTAFEVFEAKHRELVANSKEAFAIQFRSHYLEPMPIWMAIELWDFGMLARFFQVMATEDRFAVCADFGVNGGRQLQGWLEAINDLRNVCAHHSRLNRRHFPKKPGIPKNVRTLRHIASLPDKDQHRLYPMLCVLTYILDRLPGCTDWKDRVREHFAEARRSPLQDDSDFGMPPGWAEMELWRPQLLDG